MMCGERVVVCPGCERDLYRVTVVPGVLVLAGAVVPLDGVPAPVSGARTVCPFCGGELMVGSAVFGFVPRRVRDEG